MGRAKATARRGSKPAGEYDIGLDDMIPSDFINFLCNLPSADGSETLGEASSSIERPTKRRKMVFDDSVPSIHVASGEVTIYRRCIDDAPEELSVFRRDVGQYLSIDMVRNRISISARSGARVGSFSSTVSLRPQDISDHAESIILATSTNPRQATPGMLWKTVDVAVKRHGRAAEVKLLVELHWNETPTPFHRQRSTAERKLSQTIIDSVFPLQGPFNPADKKWSPMDFYDAAYVPPKDDNIAASIEVTALEATLFPYQKRTLQWLLQREGVQWTSQGLIETYTVNDANSAINAFRKLKDASGEDFYLSDVFHAVSRDITPFQRAAQAVRGGILAEEMGLGKTLEILGLVLLHPRPSPPVLTEYEIRENLIPTGATLIVAPESLRAQWMSEIANHAPGLSVKFYQGRKKLTEVDEDAAIQELAGYDIIVTTYTILSAEVHYTTTPPERSRRHERVYPRQKSPLVQISWWRVCLDEAQMIENGFSQAATVARVIPRINAWGITGTPVKDDINDLFGLLLFLQYQPYCSSMQIWQALIRNHKSVFRHLFRSISLRHTKSLVRDELLLPAQKRFVISMPFTAIEEQHYQSLYQEMTEACCVSLDGAPVTDDWSPGDYEEEMRMWLNRLRQTALHPEVAVYNRRALGHGKSRPMRTVDEVLDAMLEQSENTIRTDERAYLSSKLTRGQLYENSPRVKEALDIWMDVRTVAAKLVCDARKDLKDLAKELGESEAPRQKSKDLDGLSDSEDEPNEEDNKGRMGECRRKLRGALEMHHKAVFFCANAYFQIRDNPEMTEPDSEEFERLKRLEDDGYDEAKVLRREILRETHHKTTRLMKKIAQKASDQSFVEVAELVTGSERGIESGRVVDELESLYEELNQQANLVDELREHIIQLLLKPLVDEEDDIETTGEELGESAKIQDELMVYVQVLRAVIADRQDAMTGQTNELVKHETETSLKLAREEDGPAPKKLIELMKIRATVKPHSTSMRAAISTFRGLISRLAREETDRAAMESMIADRQMKATQKLLVQQTKAAAGLETEVERFKTTMNNRLEYYRQLQAVSDSVLPYEGPRTEAAIKKLQETEDNLRKKLSAAEAKHRYLVNLKEAGSKSNEPRMCVICQTPFTTGVLTVCGHQFCKECIMLWFKAHHNCPVCKKQLKASNLHDITINPQQLKVHSDTPDGGQNSSPDDSPQRRNSSPKKTMIYSEFNADKLAEIQNINLDGPSFTTKVDTLVKHLIWLRESDPGAKSIVFSQYKGFLNILRNAFSRFRIGYTSIDDPSGITKFKEDASVECFLLHARAHSSGLNLVNASHVFLCEPLLNTALELQAIARVDRIGQQHETTVWLYLVSGTVEESIYNLSVQRRMEHMGRNSKGKSKEPTPELLDANIEAANTLELEHAALSRLMSKDKTAGEMVERSDLWECLFGHVARRDNTEERDTRLQEQAVIGYLAAEAAERREEATK